MSNQTDENTEQVMNEIPQDSSKGQRNIIGKMLALLCWAFASYLLLTMCILIFFIGPILWQYLYSYISDAAGMSNGTVIVYPSIESPPYALPLMTIYLIGFSLGGWYFWTNRIKKGLYYSLACIIMMGLYYLWDPAPQKIELGMNISQQIKKSVPNTHQTIFQNSNNIDV